MENSKTNIKKIILVVIAILILIIIIQNRASVETKILFFTFQMPRIFLLLFTFLLGFAGGVIMMLNMSRKKEKAGKAEVDKVQ